MLSTLVHIKDKNELKIIVPFVFHFSRTRFYSIDDSLSNWRTLKWELRVQSNVVSLLLEFAMGMVNAALCC